MSIAIDQAFVDSIMRGGLALDIVHEGGGYSVWDGSAYISKQGVYEPKSGRPFIAIKCFPSGKTALSLSDTDDAVGLFQCVLNYPDDAGAMPAKQKAEEALVLFRVGSRITYSNQIVNITSNNRDGGRTEGGHYKIIVRASYRAFVPR